MEVRKRHRIRVYSKNSFPGRLTLRWRVLSCFRDWATGLDVQIVPEPWSFSAPPSLAELVDSRTIPVAVYGIDLLLTALAYLILVRTLLRIHGEDSHFAKALGSDLKGNLSFVAYISAVLLTFIYTHCPDICPLIVSHLKRKSQ